MRIVPKKWGKELWIVNCPEYCGKFLCVTKGAQSSLHKHLDKKETFYCLEGCVSLIVEDEVYRLVPKGEVITLLPGQLHSFRAESDSIILEISTHHDDNDVVRLSESRPKIKIMTTEGGDE